MGAFILLFSLMFSLICTLPIIPATVQALYPVSLFAGVLALLGGIFLKKGKNQFILSTLFCTALCLTAYKTEYSKIFVGTSDKIICIEGKLFRDSSYTKNNNLLVPVYITKATDINNNTVSARGLVNAISHTQSLICAGSEVKLYGTFSDSLFICSDLILTKKHPLEFFRSNLILLLKKRLSSCSLGEMLLLGKTDIEDENRSLKELALSCGCLHVLALSGMHLNIIGGALNKISLLITKRKILSRLISVFAVLAFLFIAGPIPSLVRAAVMYILFFLPAEERIPLAFLLQLILCPWSVFNQGSAYGYVSIIAIFQIAPLVTSALENFIPGKLARILGTTGAVLLLNAPLQLLLTGKWYPVALLAGPVAGVLITVQMALALSCLAMPDSPSFLSTKNAQLLEKLFTKASGFPPSGIKGYLIFLAVVLWLISLCLIVNKISGSKSASETLLKNRQQLIITAEDENVKRIHSRNKCKTRACNTTDP